MTSTITELDDYQTEMDERVTCSQMKHGQLILASLNTMRMENKLCDVVLRVQGKDISAHRVVLAAVSPYFSAMFTSDVRERHQGIVHLQDLDFTAVQAVVCFTYSASIELTVDNVQNLLTAATFFQVEQVIDKCCQFLDAQLHPSNSFGIQKFAVQHGCVGLARKALQFAQKHFVQVTQHEEYLQLSPEEVFAFIVDPEDAIAVFHEEDVYEAAMRWVRFDLPNRFMAIPLVATAIRFPFLSWDFLVTKVLDDGLITSNSLSLQYFEEARHLHMFPQKRVYQGSRAVQLRPRKLFGQSEWIYVIGGETSPGRRIVGTGEKFSPSLGKWVPIHAMLVPRRSHGVVRVLSGQLYAVGGSDGTSPLNQVESYCPVTDKWSSATSMNERRSSLGVAVLDGMLYAVGGYNGQETLRTVEKYDPALGQWTMVADMLNARSLLGVAALNGFLYAVGGYDGGTDLSSVERYDGRSWSPVASMKICRSMLGVSVAGDLLYAIGGSAGESLSTVEVYSHREDTWTIVAPMKELRSGVGVATVNGLLFAIGGDNGAYYLDSVECYSPSKNRWTTMPNMGNNCRRFACCS